MMTIRLVSRLALAFALVFVLVPRAHAQNPFSIDGVITDTDNSGIPGATKKIDPSGGSKELGPKNSNTTKIGVIHSAATPMLDFTNPNGQVDLTAVWTQVATAADGDQWLYFAWARDANTGSGFNGLELQQSAVPDGCVYDATGIDMVLPKSAAEQTLIDSCNPWKNRQAGDFMILWDQHGGSLDIYRVTFSGTAPNLVMSSPQLLGTAVAEYSTDGFRGEAAINLTEDVFPPGGGCVSFANTIPVTVTGNSNDADYKDVVLAAFPPISNCGLLDIKKVTLDPAGNPFAANGTFAYKIARALNEDLRYDSDFPGENLKELTGTLTNTASPATTETDSYEKLIGGTDYTLAETSTPAPWTFVKGECTVGSGTTKYTSGSIPVVVNETTHCILYNQWPAVDLSYSTAQRALLYDKITITNYYGTVSGNVTFKLFKNDPTCSVAGSQVYSEAVALASDAGNVIAATTVGVAVTSTAAAGDVYYWLVTYLGNTFNNAFSSCLENTTIKFVQ